MKGLWNNTIGKVYNSFRTKTITRDDQFDAKVAEILEADKQMHLWKHFLSNYDKNTGGLRPLVSELANLICTTYSNSSVYFPLMSEIIIAHQELEKSYIGMLESIWKLREFLEQWECLYIEAKANIEHRAKLLLIHEHYDKKMEKMVKNRDTGGKYDTPKYEERFRRVNKLLIYY